jgi:hypothetical protein
MKDRKILKWLSPRVRLYGHDDYFIALAPRGMIFHRRGVFLHSMAFYRQSIRSIMEDQIFPCHQFECSFCHTYNEKLEEYERIYKEIRCN